MSLKGNLQSVDLANVLQMLSINQKEGTLVLFDGDTRKSIYFSRDGVSMLSRGRKGQDTLGRILMRYGRITREQLDEALGRQASEKRRLGEILGDMGAATPEDIENAVRTQVEEEIYNLFIWKEASFEFVEGPPPSADSLPTQVTFNVNSLIMEAQRRADEWNYIRGLVPTLDEVYKPTETLDEATVTDDVFHLPFAPRVLEVLHEGRLNISEIIDVSCAAKFEACKILAILLEQGAVEPVSIADLQSLAQEATAAGNHEQGAKFLSRIVELGGATPPVNMQLGYALEALDEPERASLYLKAAAESYVELVEPAHAFEAYSRVVRSLPTDLAAVTAMVEIACNDPDTLAAHSHEIIEAGRTLARCQKELGRLPSALHILHRLAQATPQDLPLRNMLVLAYTESGMNNEAMAELESMAAVCTTQGNTDEAIRCLRRVAGIDRNRPGVTKKIDVLTRQRDRGKRLLMRSIAGGAVLVSLGLAAWGFLWYQGAQERHRTEIEAVISDQLDPLNDKFRQYEKKFEAAKSNLLRHRENTVEGVKKDAAALEEAIKGMDDAKSAVENRARGILADHQDDCEPTRNLVENRTVKLRTSIADATRDREDLFARIIEQAQREFREARREAEHRPLAAIPAVERAVTLLELLGEPEDLEIAIEDKRENAPATLKQLRGYREELETLQANADAERAAGRPRQARDSLADFIRTFPTVIGFRETLTFHLQVTTVPAGARIRVLGEPSEEIGTPSPRELPYTCAGGVSLEVSAEGFDSRIVDIPPLEEEFDEEGLLDHLPYELTVVLSKVPLWTLPIPTAVIESNPASTPEGKAVVLADRAGWIHLVTAEDGKEVARYDTGSLSGIAASPVVTGDSVYAATLDGVVVGLDLLGLKERWTVPGEAGPGPVAGRPCLAGNLLVAAGAGGWVKAYRVRDGSLAWEVRLPAGTRRPLTVIGGRIVALCDDGMGRVISLDGKEVLPFRPTTGSRAPYPAPCLGPLPAGGKVLLALEGPGQEISLVELPVSGSSGAYRWGVGIEGTEPAGAVVEGEDLLLLFRNGMARWATLAQGVRPGSLPFRVFGEKEFPLGDPVSRDGVFFQSTNRSLTAFRLKGTALEELWKWSGAEDVPITTPAEVVGRFIVIATGDGKVHGLLRE